MHSSFVKWIGCKKVCNYAKYYNVHSKRGWFRIFGYGWMVKLCGIFTLKMCKKNSKEWESYKTFVLEASLLKKCRAYILFFFSLKRYNMRLYYHYYFRIYLFKKHFLVTMRSSPALYLRSCLTGLHKPAGIASHGDAMGIYFSLRNMFYMLCNKHLSVSWNFNQI